MIFKTQIITDLEITRRDLEVDRRTVDYLHYSILHRQLQFQKIPLEVFLSQREV